MNILNKLIINQLINHARKQRDLLAICQVFGFLSDCRLMFLDFIFCGFILKCLLGSKTYLDGKVEMEVSG